jgi:hypothetical protein
MSGTKPSVKAHLEDCSMRTAALLLVCFAAPAVSAQEVREFPVKVRVRCQAELSGKKGLTHKLDVWSKDVKLGQLACGTNATLKVGDTQRLTAALECSHRGNDPMTFGFNLEYLVKGDAVQHVVVRNLGLDGRAGKGPVTAEGYAYLTPETVYEGVSFSRVDYTCSIETLAP